MVRCTWGSCARLRFAVAVSSFVGFVLFLLVIFHPPPSRLLPNIPPRSSKISLAIIPPPFMNASLVASFSQQILIMLVNIHLEAELLVSMATMDPPAADLFLALRQGNRHVEVLVPRPADKMAALTQVLTRAHFSTVLVVGDLRGPVQSFVRGLVEPVLTGDSDIVVARYRDESTVMGLLTYPLTRSTVARGNSSLFCLRKETWMKACGELRSHVASALLELLSKCSFHSPSSSAILPLEGPGTALSAMIMQMLLLYVELHPLCLLLLLALVSAALWGAARGLRGPALTRTLHQY